MDNIFVGIDVSKKFLDVYLHPIKKYFRTSNDAQGHLSIIEELKKHKINRIVAESTGSLEYKICLALKSEGYIVCAVNPYFAASFKLAYGRQTKTDLIDAQSLAIYGEKLLPEARGVLNVDQKQMRELLFRREQLNQMIIKEKNRLKASYETVIIDSIKLIISTLNDEKGRIENLIMDTIKTDESYHKNYNLLTSIQGVGPVVAMSLICDIPELGKLNKKQIASLVGLAPHNKESGSSFKKGHIKGGRTSIKNTIFMGSLAASRFNPELKKFYERLRENGKPKMVCLTACARKLLIFANSIVKEQRPWRENI